MNRDHEGNEKTLIKPIENQAFPKSANTMPIQNMTGTFAPTYFTCSFQIPLSLPDGAPRKLIHTA